VLQSPPSVVNYREQATGSTTITSTTTPAILSAQLVHEHYPLQLIDCIMHGRLLQLLLLLLLLHELLVDRILATLLQLARSFFSTRSYSLRRSRSAC